MSVLAPGSILTSNPNSWGRSNSPLATLSKCLRSFAVRNAAKCGHSDNGRYFGPCGGINFCRAGFTWEEDGRFPRLSLLITFTIRGKTSNGLFAGATSRLPVTTGLHCPLYSHFPIMTEALLLCRPIGADDLFWRQNRAGVPPSPVLSTEVDQDLT